MMLDMASPAEHTKRITFSVPEEVDDWLREHAWETRRSVSATLRDMIECVRRESISRKRAPEEPHDSDFT